MRGTFRGPSQCSRRTTDTRRSTPFTCRAPDASGTAWGLLAFTLIDGQYALTGFYFDDPADVAWALRCWKSVSGGVPPLCPRSLPIPTSTPDDPGFAILDEPLQQNPDPKHLEYFEHFLVKHAAIQKQVIIFTSLRDDQHPRLSEAGVRVQLVDERFPRRADRG